MIYIYTVTCLLKFSSLLVTRTSQRVRHVQLIAILFAKLSFELQDILHLYRTFDSKPDSK